MELELIKITKSDLNDKNEVTREIPFDCSLEIDANLGWVLFPSLSVRGYILAKAGSGIEAGWGIEAGDGIEAGSGIKAGSGIEAGLQITCKVLNCNLRIFVGTCSWRVPTAAEKTLTCEKYTGELAYGTFKNQTNA